VSKAGTQRVADLDSFFTADSGLPSHSQMI